MKNGAIKYPNPEKKNKGISILSNFIRKGMKDIGFSSVITDVT